MENLINLWTAFGGFIFLLIGWGIKVEIRFEKLKSNSIRIRNLEIKNDTLEKMIQENHDETMKSLHKIELELGKKQDK